MAEATPHPAQSIIDMLSAFIVSPLVSRTNKLACRIQLRKLAPESASGTAWDDLVDTFGGGR